MRIFGFEIRRSKRMPVRFLGDVVKVDLSPGDVCVLLARQVVSPKQLAEIRDAWRAAVGDDVTLMVLDDGMKLGVLSPPQAAAIHVRLIDEAAVEQAVDA